MNDWTHEKIELTLKELKERAANDPEFRKLAVENPNAAIEQIAGMKVPDFYKLKVVEADPDADQTILLPKSSSQALSESDLELISGGCNSCMSPCGVGVI